MSEIQKEIEILRQEIKDLSEKLSISEKQVHSIDVSIGNKQIHIPLNTNLIFVLFLISVVSIVGIYRAQEISNAINPKNSGFYSIEDQKVEGSGKSSQVIYSFWTPSFRTKYSDDFMSKYFGGEETKVPNSIADAPGFPKYYWVDDDNGQVIAFAEALKKIGAQGLHYGEVSGLGTTGWKKGNFWEVTFDVGVIPRNTLILLYANHWGRNKNIYLKEEFTTETYKKNQ